MKENSRIRMKMSIANELLTTSGNAIRTRDADRKPEHSLRVLALRRHRALPPPRPVGLKASVSSSIANTTINPESAPTN